MAFILLRKNFAILLQLSDLLQEVNRKEGEIPSPNYIGFVIASVKSADLKVGKNAIFVTKALGAVSLKNQPEYLRVYQTCVNTVQHIKMFVIQMRTVLSQVHLEGACSQGFVCFQARNKN